MSLTCNRYFFENDKRNFMSSSEKHAIILAAGMGTRMKSMLPKVMHKIAGRSMISHVIDIAKRAGIQKITAVVGPESGVLAEEISVQAPEVQLVVQKDRLGTAHAVGMARADLENSQADILVLYGDTPLIRPQTLAQMSAGLGRSDIVVLGFEAGDPSGYGRLILENNGKLAAIREHADASDEEKRITLCNSGVMAFRGGVLPALLDQIGNDNAKGEYYLTDAVEVAKSGGLKCGVVTAAEDDVLGINSRAQLAQAERIMQDRLRRAAMEGGATLVDPETVYLSHDTVIGRDVVIEPCVVFGPGVRIGDHVEIKGFSHIEQAQIAEGCIIGPYARLRPGADLAPGVKVGNFVEIKKSRVLDGAKVNHLSYIGDAEIGARANIGAGTITCNYDGFNKSLTRIGAGAFIGSNSALVAPVQIGDGAYVGSGSVITKDVKDDSLVVARGKQIEKIGWARAFRRANMKKGK